MSDAPKPNTMAVSWFYGEDQKKSLVLTPKYQRNPIWSIGQKCFLIDSLISGCPIPQVYINIKTEGLGRDKKTIYEVVDGQQRLHVGAHHVSTNPANRVLVHPPRRSRPGIAASKRNIFLAPGPSRVVEHPGSDIA